MNVLAVETATAAAGVAMLSGGKLLFEEYADTGYTHSETIMPMVERAIGVSHIQAEEVDVFAADVGPGSFTGIRIGVCAANAMAFALNKPVVGVNSLEALAMALPCASTVCAMLDARGEQIYAALYAMEEGIPRAIIQPSACTVSEWLDALSRAPEANGSVFTGDGALAHMTRIRDLLGGAARFAPEHMKSPRAAALAYIASHREGAKELSPMYLRVPQAERLKGQKR